MVSDILEVWRLYDVGYPNAVALTADALSPQQESLLTALVSDARKLRLFLPASATRDELLARLTVELYVPVVSSEYGLPCALSDEELEQLLA